MAAAGTPGSVCNGEQLEAKPSGQREAPWPTSREHPSQPTAFSQGRGWTVQDQIKDADDEAEAEADPGQDEGIAVVTLLITVFRAVGIVMSVDGGPHHDAQPAHQQGGPGEEEAVAFLHGEELEHEDHKGDDGEYDRQDHEGLHSLEGIFTSVGKAVTTATNGTVFPKTY